MKTGAAIAGLAVAAGLAHGQPERPVLRSLARGERVEPLRVAPAVIAGGVVEQSGEWIAYASTRAEHDACHDYRVFDCYGDHNWDGYPDDVSGCGMGENRWHFGTGYCNGFFSNDMVLAPDTIIAEGAWRADVAWYWSCAGQVTEQCVMAVFVQDSDPNECEQDTFDYPAWLIDFGDLECLPAGYYFAWIDLWLIGRWELPSDGSGSYGVMYLTDDGATPASCAQPMLWSSPNNSGGDPDGPGAQHTGQLDDDNPLNHVHELPTECYTYSFGLCNDPMGAMAQLWGEREHAPGDRADFNGDGFADSRDVIAFVSAWSACSPEADCDADGRCSSRDVLCFLDRWVECG